MRWQASLGKKICHTTVERYFLAFLMAQTLKTLPTTWAIPGSGRSPGEGNGNHFSILAWRILRTEKGAWQATVRGVCKELEMTEDEHFHFYGFNLYLIHKSRSQMIFLYF